MCFKYGIMQTNASEKRLVFDVFDGWADDAGGALLDMSRAMVHFVLLGFVIEDHNMKTLQAEKI